MHVPPVENFIMTRNLPLFTNSGCFADLSFDTVCTVSVYRAFYRQFKSFVFYSPFVDY